MSNKEGDSLMNNVVNLKDYKKSKEEAIIEASVAIGKDMITNIVYDSNHNIDTFGKDIDNSWVIVGLFRESVYPLSTCGWSAKDLKVVVDDFINQH